MTRTPRRFLIAGAGFSGAVLARELAEAGHPVEVRERRAHIAGNCHTERHADTGVLVHVYGPHIFHTDDEQVWNYLGRFAEMRSYVNRVKTVSGGKVYSLPINLHTINQFFGTAFNPREAENFIRGKADAGIGQPANFEEQALKFVGPELYRAFLEGYTRKQWGVDPRELPASILKRLPLRFDYNDNYYAHRFQGLPRDGYTEAVRRILDHPGIELHLDREVAPRSSDADTHVFWTGPLDAWFDHRFGHLRYRTLDFVPEIADGDFQGNAVLNYGDVDVPWTRITEHKHFAPWESHARTVVYREYSRECTPQDVPYYPVRLVSDKALLARYLAEARAVPGVTFLGRLGTYRYLDMDASIREALDAAAAIKRALAEGNALKPFYVDPG